MCLKCGASLLSSTKCPVNLQWSRHPWRVRSDASIACFTGEHLAEPLPASSAYAASLSSLPLYCVYLSPILIAFNAHFAMPRVIRSGPDGGGAAFPEVFGQMSQESAGDRSRCLHLCGAGEGGCPAAELFVGLLQRMLSFQVWEQVVCLLLLS